MNNPIITTENAALYFASVRRAETLFTEGRYSFEYETLEAVAVRTPAYPFGEINDGEYTVDAIEGTCNCPQFAKHGFCKHEIAISVTLEEAIKWDAICAEVETRAALEVA